ncbi:MAG: GAF domain-containing protein [Spirulinaceae cyanobacterium RM2_2_10]|nr:GAF domain-containing protein [Spirulinaceae cyanobacterium RM2_2_10]
MTATQPAQSSPKAKARNHDADLAALSELQAEFQRQRQQIAAIAREFSQAADLDALLVTAVEAVRDLTAASRVLIYQFASGDRGTVLAESVERGWTPAQEQILPATMFGADGQADYAEDDSLAIDDSSEADLTPYQQQLFEQYQVRSSLAVSLRPAGRLWGLLVVQQCQEARAWSPQDIALLEQIASRLALSLINYDVREQLQQQQAREAAVSQVIDRMRRSLDLKVIFQTTTQEVRRLLGADRVGIFRFNADWSGKFIAEAVGDEWISLLQNPVDPEVIQDNAQDCNLKLMVNGAQTKNYNAALGEVKDSYLERTQGGNYAQGDQIPHRR